MSKRSSEDRVGQGRERGNQCLSLVKYVLRTKEPLTIAYLIVQRTTLFSERNLFPRVFALAAGLLLIVVPATAHETGPLRSELRQALVIDNTGSTNTSGYKIYVLSTGKIFWTDGRDISAPGPYDGSTLPKAQVKQLFQDLAAAMPLTALPVRHGMRSASFGTQTYITYKGQQSPDLTLGGDAKTAALKADVDAITRWLGIGNTPRRPFQARRPL